MRRSLIVLLALATGIGTLVVLERLRPPPAEVVEPLSAEILHVLVYGLDLPRGSEIDESSLRWQQQLRSAVPVDAVTSPVAEAPFPETIVGKPIRRDAMAGEWVRPGDLLERGAGFMALTLTPGTRAVGLSVTDQKLAGGFILPEDRIDLIHTVTGDFDGDGRQGGFSQTFLENIRVLAIGPRPTSRTTFQTAEEQAAAAQQTNDIVMKGETITLEMTDEEAEILFSALASGQVSLALRAIDDHGPSRILSIAGFETTAPGQAPADSASATATPDSPTAMGTDQNEPDAALAQSTTVAQQAVRIISGGGTSFVDVPRARMPEPSGPAP
jgi:pilus assembly protein CpaB